jgi:hypothetical protein
MQSCKKQQEDSSERDGVLGTGGEAFVPKVPTNLARFSAGRLESATGTMARVRPTARKCRKGAGSEPAFLLLCYSPTTQPPSAMSKLTGRDLVLLRAELSCRRGPQAEASQVAELERGDWLRCHHADLKLPGLPSCKHPSSGSMVICLVDLSSRQAFAFITRIALQASKVGSCLSGC